MTPSRFVVGIAATGLLALAACSPNPTQPRAEQPVTGPQPTNVGGTAAAPVVPGTARIMGGTGNADIQRVPAGPGVQAPIVRGTGQIQGGLGNAEVERMGGGPPAR